jgi:hypothetical protein
MSLIILIHVKIFVIYYLLRDSRYIGILVINSIIISKLFLTLSLKEPKSTYRLRVYYLGYYYLLYLSLVTLTIFF